MTIMKTCHHLSLFYLLITIYFGQTRADVATLYEVSTTAIPTLTDSIRVVESGATNVRAIGTGTDGKTTYVQDNIVSLYVAKFPLPDDPSQTATTTLISKPQTIAVTFAEDKNGYHATRSLSIVSPTNSALDFQAGLDEKCVFYPNGTGSCVRIDIGLDTATRTTLSTRTYTGTLAPWYTVGNDVRAAAGSQSQTTTTTRSTSNGAYFVKGSLRLGGGNGLGMLVVVMGVGVSAGLGMLGYSL